MDRELTSQEHEWLERGLATLATGEYDGGGRWIDCSTGKLKPLDDPIDPTFWLDQVSSLRVIEECDCGEPQCASVKFQNFESGKSVALVVAGTGDKRLLIIHMHEDSGLITELEIV